MDVQTHNCFFLQENADDFPLEDYDYIVDAVDTVTAKIALVMKAKEKGVPIISSMGAGNKLDAMGSAADGHILDWSCGHFLGIYHLQLAHASLLQLAAHYLGKGTYFGLINICYFELACICPPGAKHKCTERRDIPGSVAFVPSAAGLIIAGEVVKDLCAASPK